METIPVYPTRLSYWIGNLREHLNEPQSDTFRTCSAFFGRPRPTEEPEDDEFGMTVCDDMLFEMRHLLDDGGDEP